MNNALPSELLIATKNAGKIAELRDLMQDIPVGLKFLPDLSGIEVVEETGTTFQQNAELKASAYACATGSWAIADDSGLEVDALGGAPGVYSARYGGEYLPFAGKMKKLLRELSDSGALDRTAQFRCVMAIANSDGNILFTAEGVSAGTIAEKPRGSGGFGYDPIFVPEGFSETFGELARDIKQQISHRGRAAELIMRYLLHFNDV
ncbi:MAG: RdgB/HAM1 family non-canonical purine NTP pyrophosphatase [Pyrinomonadaceae bacterium]